MNLTEMVARVREDLQDTDAENYRWTDDEVQAAIHRVVIEYSLHAPIEQQDDIATTDGRHRARYLFLVRTCSKSSPWSSPSARRPSTPQSFEYWAGHLYMQDEGDGTNARVRWLKKHTLAAGSTTIPTEHEEIIVLGATGYLAMSASAATVDRAFIAGHYGTTSYGPGARTASTATTRSSKPSPAPAESSPRSSTPMSSANAAKCCKVM